MAPQASLGDDDFASSDQIPNDSSTNNADRQQREGRRQERLRQAQEHNRRWQERREFRQQRRRGHPEARPYRSLARVLFRLDREFDNLDEGVPTPQEPNRSEQPTTVTTPHSRISLAGQYIDRDSAIQEQLFDDLDQQAQGWVQQTEQTIQVLQRSRHTNQLALQSLATPQGLRINSINTTRPPSRIVTQVTSRANTIQHAIQHLDIVQGRLPTVELHRDPELTLLAQELDRMEEEVELLREQTGMLRSPRSPREGNHHFDSRFVRLDGSLDSVDGPVSSRQESTRTSEPDEEAFQRRMHGQDSDASRRPIRAIGSHDEELNQLERDLRETDRLLQPLGTTALQAPIANSGPSRADSRRPRTDPQPLRVDILRPNPPPTARPIPRSNPRPTRQTISPYNPRPSPTTNPTNQQIAQLTRQVNTLETELQEARATVARQEQLIEIAFNYAIMEEERHQHEQESLSARRRRNVVSSAEMQRRQAEAMHEPRAGELEERGEGRVLRGENLRTTGEFYEPWPDRRIPRRDGTVGIENGPTPVTLTLRPRPEVRPGNTNTPTWREERRTREEGVRLWVERQRGEEDRVGALHTASSSGSRPVTPPQDISTPMRETAAHAPETATPAPNGSMGAEYINTAGRRADHMRREDRARGWVTRTMGHRG